MEGLVGEDVVDAPKDLVLAGALLVFDVPVIGGGGGGLCGSSLGRGGEYFSFHPFFAFTRFIFSRLLAFILYKTY